MYLCMIKVGTRSTIAMLIEVEMLKRWALTIRIVILKYDNQGVSNSIDDPSLFHIL